MNIMQSNVNILLCVALSCMGLVSGKPSAGYAATMPTYSQPMSYEKPAYAEPYYDVQDVVSNLLSKYFMKTVSIL